MSSTEKILVNIFERKNSIIEQIKQQSRSFDHYLASMCLLQGLQVPPWIFSNEDHIEFEKEDIISGLLLPLLQPSVLLPGSVIRYQEPSVTTFGGNYAVNRLSSQFVDEAHCASHVTEGLDVGVSHCSHVPTVMCDDEIYADNRLSVIPQFAGEAPCASRATEELDVCVSEQMPTVDDVINPGSRLSVIPHSSDEAPSTSHAAEQIDVSVSSPVERGCVENNGQGQVQSLLRIQRSKSRQKALQLRNSVNSVRSSSHNDDNLDRFCRRIGESGVVSLSYDHADNAGLCEPINTENETCIEGAKDDAFGSCGPKVDPLNEQWNSDYPTNIAKEDGLEFSSKRLTEQPNNSIVLLKPVVSSIDSKVKCAGKEIGTNDCKDNKQIGNVVYSSIKMSETSSGLLSSAKEPCNISKSCHSTNQVRHGLVDESVEQLSLVDGSLQSAKPSSAISNRSSRAHEAKHGIKRSNQNDSSTYIGRVTRSRSCRQKPLLSSDHLNLGGSTIYAYKAGGDDRTKAATNAPSLSHFDINNENSNLKEHTFGSESNIGDVLRDNSCISRSCAKPIKRTSERSNLDCFQGKSNRDDGVEKLKEQTRIVDGSMTIMEFMDISDESCGVEGKIFDNRNIEDGTDASSGRVKGLRSSGLQLGNVEQLPMEENASNIAKPPSSKIPQHSCSSQEAAVNLQRASGSEQIFLPFPESSNFIDLPRAVMATEIACAERVEGSDFSGSASVESSPGLECDVVVADSDIESAGRHDPCTLNSDPTPDGASLGMETLNSVPSVERASLMKPKELDFGDGQDFCLTKTCDLELETEQKNTSTEVQSSILHHIPNIITSVNHEEKPTSSAEMPLSKEHELSAKLLHSKNLNLERRDMNVSLFENLIADSCFKGSLAGHKEVQNECDFNDEIFAPAMKAFQCNQYAHDVVLSTVIEGEHQDAQLYITNQPNLVTPNLQTEKDQCFSEVRDRSSSVSLLNEHLEAFSVSSPKESVADLVSQALLTRTGEEANSVCGALNASMQYVAEERKAHFQLEDKFEASMEPFIDRVGVDAEANSSISAMFPHNESQVLISTDQNMPELEGFVMGNDDDHGDIVDNGVDFAKAGYSSTGIERASLIEQLCKSACLHTPLSHLSTTFGLHEKLTLYQSTPGRLLEGLKTLNTPKVDADISTQFVASPNDEHNFVISGSPSSDCLPSSTSRSSWDIKNPFVSPVGEYWNGITSKSSSSGKRLSSNMELPSISEENECTDELAKTFQEDTIKEEDKSVKREPLADITKSLNPLLPVFESEVLEDRCSVASVNQDDHGRNYVFKAKENSLLPSNVKRANGSLNSRAKSSEKLNMRRDNSNIRKRESKRNNIVSNVTSFIPFVLKQADANIAGKRDVKVKSLEAAEVTRRNLEKKEIERKIRKEALQRERAQKEQENIKQIELDKEKKEIERRKKLADNAAKKRQREEEEKKEKERKRKCVEEKRRQLLEEEEKRLRTKKENKELRSRAAEKKSLENKEHRLKLQKHENIEKAKGHNCLAEVLETEPTGASTNHIREEVSTVVRSSENLSDCGEKLQVMSHTGEAIQNNNLDLTVTEEQSYEISPYKSSDDEEEEDDDEDIRKSKFVPSWSSKNHLAMLVSSQQKLDPESIFPPESFCNITEVLLPRRLQQKVAPK